MALDGVVYAGIARHLAEGHGTFWFPPHFEAAAAAFHDHPPLGIWLQSLWFRVWGDAFWVESLYCAGLLLLLAWLMARVYRALSGNQAGWWPLLLLLLMPVSARVLRSNLLDVLLVLTALGVVWCAWRAQRQPAWDVPGASCVSLVFLLRGPWLCFRWSRRR